MAFVNLKLNQGSDKVVGFKLKCKNENGEEVPVDLTGFNAAMQVRVNKEDSRPIDTLTNKNGRIYIGDAGLVRIIFPNKKTEKYPIGRTYYDIEIISAEGIVTRIIEGKINVSGEVTRV